MKRPAAAATLIVALLLVGWDTSEDPVNKWAAAYLFNLPSNEHASISDTTLRAMGATNIAIDGNSDEFLNVVDLTTSFFRRGQLGAHVVGDDSSTTLEERDVPSPAHLAGLPDFSWTIYDWINKNSICPSVPPAAQFYLTFPVCHEYEGWLGNLNAIHFGTQSEVAYDHFHRVALNLATRAAALRVQFQADPNAESEFAPFVEEAELEALAYEAFGQHFLQDRWSSGHFWERWNASDYDLLPNKLLPINFLIGAMSGVVHGAQAVVGGPDPLCSPVYDGTTATPIEWSHPDFGLLPGVGDYRWQEIIDSGEGNFLGAPYQVFTQYERLIECGMRGWAQVIRTFGSNGDGTFGASSIPLNGNAPPASASPVDPDCKGAWATNEAMRTGWGIDRLSVLGRLAIQGAFSALNRNIRIDITQIGWTLWKNATLNPAGTEMARGGMGPLGGAQPGNNYADSVPGYAEPQNFADLPFEPTETGRDQATIFGFFNRAHADHWCDAERFKETVTPLRGSADATDRLVCAYFAERMYRGVDPSYTRFVEARVGTSTLPVCHMLGTQEAADADDDLPYYVHPGYMATPGATAPAGPAPSDPMYLETIRNWCDRIPIINVDANDLAAEATIEAFEVSIVIVGNHFGQDPGTVTLEFAGLSPARVDAPVLSWNNNLINLRVPRSSLPDPIDDVTGTVIVERADGAMSVGERFVQFGAGAKFNANVYVFDGKHYYNRQMFFANNSAPPCGTPHYAPASFTYPDGGDFVSVTQDRIFSFEDPSVPLFDPAPNGCRYGVEAVVAPTLTEYEATLSQVIAFCDAYRAAFLPLDIDPETVNPGQAIFTMCRNQVEFLSDFELTWPME